MSFDTAIWTLSSSTQIIFSHLAFYGTPRFIKVFIRTCHWTLSCARCINSTPSHVLSITSILMLSSYRRLFLPSGLSLLQVLQPKFYMHFSFLPSALHTPLASSCNFFYKYDILQFELYVSWGLKYTERDQD